MIRNLGLGVYCSRLLPIAFLCVVIAPASLPADVYLLSVTPIGTYDSRWDGTNYDPVGTNGYIRDVNGAPVLASVWESSFDTIWAQAGVDLRLETQQNLDMNAYVSSAVNPVNILNFQSSAQQNLYYSFPSTNTALEADLAGFNSSTGSAETHYMLFTNSYSNGTPLNTDFNNPVGPLAGGLEGFSASGLAITPSPDSVWRMRTIMATGAGVTQALEGLFNSPSGLPTVLAHELGHNGSLRHLNTATRSQHYDPMRSDALMWTGGGSSGSENVLNAGEVADTLRTMDLNGTLALAAGQTGTFWDTNGSTAGYGGTGTWDGAANNWGRPTGLGLSGTWVGAEVAVFRASGDYNVEVSGAQTATGIAVQVGNPTFSGGTINLTNAKAGVDGRPEIFVESNRTATFDSVISGGGAEPLTKLGAGTLILNGANTYTGGTQIRRGELQGNSASIQGNVELVNGANAIITTRLHFNQTVDGNFAGNITGSGDEVRKSGSGSLTLTSNVLSYTGVTNIDAGRLNINGSKSGADNVNVAVGASLGGTGSIAGNTTVLGSIDLRDAVSGTLEFTDSLAYGPNAFTTFEISGTADRIVVGDQLTLDGLIMFQVDSGHAFASSDVYDLYDWGTASFGLFSVASDLVPNLPLLTAGLEWDTSNFQVNGTISVVPEPSAIGLTAMIGCVGFWRRRRILR